jgi:hypothetical protein
LIRISSRQWAIDNILKGDKIPEPFGEDSEAVRERKRGKAEEHLRSERERRAAELLPSRPRRGRETAPG